MAQRKAHKMISSQPETMKSHVKLERQTSSQKHQDTRNRGGGDGEVSDLKRKKMKLERSMRAADLESLKSMKPKKQSPNYMKPTSSSDARKVQLQVKPSLQNSRKLNSLKALRPLMNRATCSSTLRDSKFPQALELNPEGISLMRVCPYTYCSLNGHRHDEPLPPLRSFMKARRKLIKTQKNTKLKGVSSLRVKGLGKDEGEIDTGQKAMVPSMEEVTDDFFVEIYTGRSEDEEDDQTKESYEDTIIEDGVNKRIKLSNEADVMMSFLEHVECDQKVDDAEEEEKTSFVSEESETEESSFDFNWEEEVDNPFPDNITESSQCPDDFRSLIPPQIESSIKETAYEIAEAIAEKRQEANQESADGVNEGHAELEQEVDHKVVNDTESHEAEELCVVDVLNQKSSEQVNEAEDALLKIKDEENENEVDNTCLLSDQIQNQPETTFKCENATKLSYSYTRKKITNEQDEIREFNPRAPRFLELEPDPESEKVDLRHQMMDERKNSEEYLIDYALRMAVTKLVPARKKKVALLVEAFETVMPYGKPLGHEASGFTLARIMQACS